MPRGLPVIILASALLSSCLFREGGKGGDAACGGGPCFAAGHARAYRIWRAPSDLPCDLGEDGILRFRVMETRSLGKDSAQVRMKVDWTREVLSCSGRVILSESSWVAGYAHGPSGYWTRFNEAAPAPPGPGDTAWHRSLIFNALPPSDSSIPCRLGEEARDCVRHRRARDTGTVRGTDDTLTAAGYGLLRLSTAGSEDIPRSRFMILREWEGRPAGILRTDTAAGPLPNLAPAPGPEWRIYGRLHRETSRDTAWECKGVFEVSPSIFDVLLFHSFKASSHTLCIGQGPAEGGVTPEPDTLLAGWPGIVRLVEKDDTLFAAGIQDALTRQGLPSDPPPTEAGMFIPQREFIPHFNQGYQGCTLTTAVGEWPCVLITRLPPAPAAWVDEFVFAEEIGFFSHHRSGSRETWTALYEWRQDRDTVRFGPAEVKAGERVLRFNYGLPVP